MYEASEQPSAWVTRFAHLVAASAQVLDVACGAGRHARWFARRGCRVLAIDRDAGLLDTMRGVPGITTLHADIEREPWPVGQRTFDAIVVTHYLHRPLLDTLKAALAPDGVLLFETFAEGNQAFGKPSNPDFLLRRDELRRVFGGALTVVAFEQGEVHGAARHAVVQRLAAVGRGRPWPPLLDAG